MSDIVYKVVYNQRWTGFLLSARVHPWPKYCKRYYLNKWTTVTKTKFSKGYGICVFTRKYEAIRFALSTDKIFIAEAEDLIEELPIDKIFISVPFNWSRSTKMYRRIKLIKELKY